MLVAVIGCLALPAAANAAGTLTPMTFAAFDAVYTTSIPLERGTPTAGQYGAARAACRGLDAADPRLGFNRRACTASAGMLKGLTAFERCRTPLGCLRSARTARMQASELIGFARRSNVEIDALMLVPKCRSSLRTSQKDLGSLIRMRDLLRLVERVSMTGSPRLLSRLEREADALDRLLASTPTTARERKLFRVACAPTAPA